MTIIEKLDQVEHLLKHQPGRHDQKRHAGERGGSDADFESWASSVARQTASNIGLSNVRRQMALGPSAVRYIADGQVSGMAAMSIGLFPSSYGDYRDKVGRVIVRQNDDDTASISVSGW